MSYHFLCKRGIRPARTEQFLVKASDLTVVSGLTVKASVVMTNVIGLSRALVIHPAYKIYPDLNLKRMTVVNMSWKV